MSQAVPVKFHSQLRSMNTATSASGYGDPSSVSTSPSTPLINQVRSASNRAEDFIDRIFTPMKPYVGVVGRFLLVVTFLEDSLRIITQWHDQVWYLSNHRSMNHIFAHFFLVSNVAMMLSASTMAVMQIQTLLAVGLLFLVIISQAIGYGLMLDFAFFLRNMALIGGLLILLADAYYKKSRARAFFPGLPEVSESQRTTYLQLVGRLLLALLFASFVFGGSYDDEKDDLGIFRVVFMVAGACACLMVALGFKAKRSAIFLAIILSVFNVIINSWWSVHHTHPQRDFMKYDFFQTLSIMGGLILLSSIGPGNLSFDEKKKAY